MSNKTLRAYHVQWGPFQTYYASYTIDLVSKAVRRHLIVTQKVAKGQSSLMSVKRAPQFDTEVQQAGVFVPASLEKKLIPFWYTEVSVSSSSKTVDYTKVPQHCEVHKKDFRAGAQANCPHCLLKAAIGEVLYQEWDPIGCGVPEDEYDSYVPEVYALLVKGSESDTIVKYLAHIETAYIGLNGRDLCDTKLQEVAHKLLSLGAEKIHES